MAILGVVLERHNVLFAPVDAADAQHKHVRRARAHFLVVPVLASAAEAELDDALEAKAAHVDVAFARQHRLLANAVDAFAAAVDLHVFAWAVGGRVGPAPLPVLLKRWGARDVEVPWVVGVVPLAKFLVGHGELGGIKGLCVCFGGFVDVACAPAWIAQLPDAVVNLDGGPGVPCWAAGWKGCALDVAKALAVADNDDSLEAAVCCESNEESGVALADGKSGGKSGRWRGRFDVVGEEGFGVVCDIVVQPDEDGSSLVCERSKGRSELSA